ncbi:serine/threonine protein phosphatase [Pelomyxa schiedti]|nr:serine/threonine protein phosphatase [Pelomyxa schiedti]
MASTVSSHRGSTSSTHKHHHSHHHDVDAEAALRLAKLVLDDAEESEHAAAERKFRKKVGSLKSFNPAAAASLSLRVSALRDSGSCCTVKLDPTECVSSGDGGGVVVVVVDTVAPRTNLGLGASFNLGIQRCQDGDVGANPPGGFSVTVTAENRDHDLVPVGVDTPSPLVDSSGSTQVVPTDVPLSTSTTLSAGSSASSASITSPVRPEEYRGHHLKDPHSIQDQDIPELLHAFSSNQMLPEWYVAGIYVAAHQHFKSTLTTVMFAPIPKNGRTVVVGDLHGQLTDLVTILQTFGLPSLENIYVFNGDFVDRGPQSLEVLTLLFAMHMHNPSSVYLNRGNHEDRHMNEKYGFESQVLKLYSLPMFELIEKALRYLPLATVISSRVIVMHGGLSEFGATVTVEPELINLPRGNTEKKLAKNPPSGVTSATPSGVSAAKRAKKILNGILWSDPMEEAGIKTGHRGSSVSWGTDVTEQFLSANNLDLLIRSHQVKDSGFEWSHNNKVLTLFSASNYGGTAENKAGVAVFRGAVYAKLSTTDPFPLPEIETFHASSFHTEESDNASSSDDTLQKIKERIFLKRHLLINAFASQDISGTGKVSIETFVAVLQDILGLPGVRWNVLWVYLAEEDGGMINYCKFLNRHKPKIEGLLWAELTKELVHKISVSIFREIGSLENAFAKYDIDGNHLLSFQEFRSAVTSSQLGITDEQCFDLFHQIDKNDDGQIDFAEFISKFKPDFDVAPESEWKEKKIHHIYRHLCKKHGSISATFNEFKSRAKAQPHHLHHHNSILTPEFILMLSECGIKITSEELHKLSNDCFVGEGGREEVNIKKFKSIFKQLELSAAEKSNSAGFYDSVMLEVARVIHTQSLQIMRLFRQMDVDGVGFLSPEELKVGLEALNVLLKVPLTDKQIERLHRLLDTNGDGRVSYKEFLDGLTPHLP